MQAMQGVAHICQAPQDHASQQQEMGILLRGVACKIMKQADELHVLDLEVW